MDPDALKVEEGVDLHFVHHYLVEPVEKEEPPPPPPPAAPAPAAPAPPPVIVRKHVHKQHRKRAVRRSSTMRVVKEVQEPVGFSSIYGFLNRRFFVVRRTRGRSVGVEVAEVVHKVS